MSPYLHHARTFATWVVRRPFTAVIGTLFLGVPGAMAAAFLQPRALEAVPVGGPLVVAGMASIFGLILGSMAEPSRGELMPREGRPMTTLPLRPGPRVAAEMSALVVWGLGVAALLVALVAAGPRLGGTWRDIAAFVAMPGGRGFATGALLVLPGFAVARRVTLGRDPSALGSLLAAWLLTLLPTVAMQVHVAFGATLAVLAAAVAVLVTPWVERRAQALSDGVVSRTELGGDRDRAWHARPAALLMLAVRKGVPGILVVLTLMLMQPSLRHPLIVLLLLLSPLFFGPITTPLGLGGRTASPRGRSNPYGGDARRAWSLLPVEPRTVRRAALRQVGFALVILWACAGLVAVGVAQGWVELTVMPFALFLIGLTAVSPLMVCAMLGDAFSRRGAQLVGGGLLFCPVVVGLGDPFFGVVAGVLTFALVVAGGLTLRMLRPFPDEVSGSRAS